MESPKIDNEISRKNLTRVISDYRRNRERLINIQKSTKDHFEQIIELLKPESNDLLDCVDANNFNNVSIDLGLIDEPNSVVDVVSDNEFSKKSLFDKLSRVNVEIGNPAIAIVGQVKSGKSTFVNVLLQKNVVCQAFERCTARLTRLTYSENNFVEIIDSDGKILERKPLKSTTIPQKFLKLRDKDRNNETEIRKLIKAGIKSNFLKNGIDIIDSPGLSENATLNNLSKDMIKSILPVMIYVIDGRTSVKQTDISDLLELKNSVPNLQIIFFITKLDTDDDSSEIIDSSINPQAELKMEMAFKKLQYHNFIPMEISDWSECNYLHGASLYSLMDYYEKKLTCQSIYHYNLFSKFEENLHQYLLINFRNKIEEACNTLIDFQMEVLTKIINRAKSLSEFNIDNLKQIDNIKCIEDKLYNKILLAINESKSDLKKRLINRLKNESDAIINPITDIVYPNSLEIPSNGIVSDVNIITQCQNIIMYGFCQGLENVIKQFVEEELFFKYRKAVEDQLPSRMKIKFVVNELNLAGKSSYEQCLERKMAEIYKFNSLGNFANSDGSNTAIKFMTVVFKSVKKFLLRGITFDFTRKSVDVRDNNWKLQQAKKCLERCNYKILAKEVCNGLVEDFNNKHDAFLVALEFEYKCVQKKIEISEEIRTKLADKAPDFAGLIMLTLDVRGRYFLQDLEVKEEIGRGAQGIIYRCTCNGEEIAKKTTKVPGDRLQDIAEEIYYSYSFDHPHLLPIIAISIEDTEEEEKKEISVYSPLMKTDVLKYLKQNKITLKERVKIAIQVAEALQYLHSQNIMHRDLKLANILLDESNNVYLADYGLCKSLALTEFSYAGTPLHIAPEIIKMTAYDSKVDIYSFGMLLWYLAEGRGRNPQYSREYNGIITIDMRPERLGQIPNELWTLIEQCWDENPILRPNILDVIQNLRIILEIIS